jgi:hypothetical protein
LLGNSGVFAETSVYGNENRFLFSSPEYLASGEAKNALSAEPIPANNPASTILAEKTAFFAGYTGFWNNSFWTGNTYATLKIDPASVFSVFTGYLSIPGIDSVSRRFEFEGADTIYEITQVSSSELSINFNYARKFLDFERFDLSLGVSLNFMRRRLVEWTGYGIGADLGVLLTTNRGNFVGFQIDNITTQYTHWSPEYYENTLPQAFLSYGFSKELNSDLQLKLFYRSPDLFGNSGVTANTLGNEAGFNEKIRSGSIRQNPENLFVAAGYGGELLIKKIVTLRLGLTDSHKMTFGGGINLFERAAVDFAYIYSSALDGTYGVSLRVEL